MTLKAYKSSVKCRRLGFINLSDCLNITISFENFFPFEVFFLSQCVLKSLSCYYVSDQLSTWELFRTYVLITNINEGHF